MRRWILMVLSITALTAGCQYPRDPDGTLNRVEGGVMRVGVTHADPWVLIAGEEPSGCAEVELVRRFARDLGARMDGSAAPRRSWSKPPRRASSTF